MCYLFAMFIKIMMLVYMSLKTFTNGLNMVDDDTKISDFKLIAELVKINYKSNGWTSILTVGDVPDEFYKTLVNVGTFVNIKDMAEDHDIEDTVPYSSNSILLVCNNFTDYENVLLKTMGSPYWHPLANIIVYYKLEGPSDHGRIFFSLWYYRASNAIVIQHDEPSGIFSIAKYSAFINKNYFLENNVGCWTESKVGTSINSFEEFLCEEGCHNVSLNSQLRAKHLGTCLGYSVFKFTDIEELNGFVFFEEKVRNFHGHTFRAHVIEIPPFLGLRRDADGKETLHQRDGLIWKTMSEQMNFTIDFSPSRKFLDILSTRDFEINIKQIVDLGMRRVDLLLVPVYLMDLVVVEVDMSFTYKESGICILAHRSDFVTSLYDAKTFMKYFDVFIEFVLCFISLWSGFLIFYVAEKSFSLDTAGLALTNAIRNVLSISLHKPPKKKLFRFLMTTSIWGFFIINFATQAAIISYFTTMKRGREINTFEDVIEKGYPIIGIPTPDAVLPETEERFVKINSKLVATNDMYACASQMLNDSHRFCLTECSHARHLQSNNLDDKGHQYLHVAEDRIHSRYLAMALYKHSPMTDLFNKYLMAIVEAGLIKKWEDYRYNELKEDVPTKPLNISDLSGVFQVFALMVGFSFGVFLGEVLINIVVIGVRIFKLNYAKWHRVMLVRRQLKLQKKQGRIKFATVSTQTI